MSTPAQADTQSDTEDFASKVNSAVKAMSFDKDTETWNLPKGLSDEVKYAATAEKRVRDNQADRTRLAQQNKVLEADKANLLAQLKEDSQVIIPTERKDELDDLKFSDPEKWRTEINKLEDSFTRARDKKISETLDANAQKVELERRTVVLSEFNQENPDLEINDDVIDNDIPPRIKDKLETGKISFDDFLGEVKDYLTSDKKIYQGDKTLNQPNLGDVGGGSTPTESGDSSKGSYQSLYDNPAL
jgi:hypothetical protein